MNLVIEHLIGVFGFTKLWYDNAGESTMEVINGLCSFRKCFLFLLLIHIVFLCSLVSKNCTINSENQKKKKKTFLLFLYKPLKVGNKVETTIHKMRLPAWIIQHHWTWLKTKFSGIFFIMRSLFLISSYEFLGLPLPLFTWLKSKNYTRYFFSFPYTCPNHLNCFSVIFS